MLGYFNFTHLRHTAMTCLKRALIVPPAPVVAAANHFNTLKPNRKVVGRVTEAWGRSLAMATVGFPTVSKTAPRHRDSIRLAMDIWVN